MQLDQLRRSSLLGPGDLKLPDRKLSKRSMPKTAEPLISDHVLNHPHVPFADTDGSNDERKPRSGNQLNQRPLEVIVPSGGSSPHGLDLNYSFASATSQTEHTTSEYTTDESRSSDRVEIDRHM